MLKESGRLDKVDDLISVTKTMWWQPQEDKGEVANQHEGRIMVIPSRDHWDHWIME